MTEKLGIERLRRQIQKLFYDFDRHLGPFSWAAYYSPYDFVGKEWADRTGCELDELRLALSYFRDVKVTKRSVPENCAAIIEDFQNAVQEWKDRNNIARKPFDAREFSGLQFEKRKIRLTCLSRFGELDLRDIWSGQSSRDFDIAGSFKTDFGFDAELRVRIDYKSGGELSFSIIFPFYDHDNDPTNLQSWNLFGNDFFYTIGTREIYGLDPPPGVLWYADQRGADCRSLDGFFVLVDGVLAYLKSN